MAMSMPLKLPNGNDLDVLLVGITGHGKSATGNTLMRRDDFLSLVGFDSVTKEMCSKSRRIDSYALRVVDTPGFDDTDKRSMTTKNKLVIDSLITSLTECPQGFHAILLVMRFDQRLKSQDKDTIEFWMKMIGKDNFKSHGIIILTGGDVFRKENGTKLTVNEWWRFQSSENQLFFKNCGERCVLFNNKADLEGKKAQFCDLMMEIDGRENTNRCIPNCCQISFFQNIYIIPDEKRLVETISELDKKFTILLNDVEDFSGVEDEQDGFNQLKNEVANIRQQLMEIKHKQILTEFEAKFAILETKEIRRDLLRQSIVDTQLKLTNLKQSTEYWGILQNSVLSKIKLYGPVLFSVAFYTAGFATPGVNVIFASVVGGIFGLTALGVVGGLVYDKFRRRNDSKKDDESN